MWRREAWELAGPFDEGSFFFFEYEFLVLPARAPPARAPRPRELPPAGGLRLLPGRARRASAKAVPARAPSRAARVLASPPAPLREEPRAGKDRAAAPGPRDLADDRLVLERRHALELRPGRV